MNRPVKRLDFFRGYACTEVARAATWRQAWWVASQFGRTPRVTLRFFRTQMRLCALCALDEARRNVTREAA